MGVTLINSLECDQRIWSINGSSLLCATNRAVSEQVVAELYFKRIIFLKQIFKTYTYRSTHLVCLAYSSFIYCCFVHSMFFLPLSCGNIEAMTVDEAK